MHIYIHIYACMNIKHQDVAQKLCVRLHHSSGESKCVILYNLATRVRRDSIMCDCGTVKWLVYTWQDSLIRMTCVSRVLSYVCIYVYTCMCMWTGDMTHSYVTWLTHQNSLLSYVSGYICIYMYIYMYVCVCIWTGKMTHSYVTSLTHQNNLIVPFPGLCMYTYIHVCVYVNRWHDSFIRDTLTRRNSLTVPCPELRGVWYRHHWISGPWACGEGACLVLHLYPERGRGCGRHSDCPFPRAQAGCSVRCRDHFQLGGSSHCSYGVIDYCDSNEGRDGDDVRKSFFS